jgi:FADH2 O2-dependent halogenase
MVDSATHPRFALGESSTPLADFLLEHIADEFGLVELRSLSRWGSWQRDLPQLRAGKKRGFSYFEHSSGEHFNETSAHERSLLVAASTNDEVSDTHWMRSDVDHWLFKKACSAGAQALLQATVSNVTRSGERWNIKLSSQAGLESLDAREIVDASGGAGVLGQALKLAELSNVLKTKNSVLFGHFLDVASMSQWLQANGLGEPAPVFDSDDAAQHHLIDEGWLWMLRFNDGTTSVGLVESAEGGEGQQGMRELDGSQRLDRFKRRISKYPTLGILLENARLIAPEQGLGAGLGALDRMSRLWSIGAGDGWVMLPSTVGIVDPLHSTGIAHALTGVQRVARFLIGASKDGQRVRYGVDAVQEVRWIDRLVAVAYAAKSIDFSWFNAATCLYFLAAIECERQMAESGRMPCGFLAREDAELLGWIRWFENRTQALASMEASELPSELNSSLDAFRGFIKSRNEPGFLEPDLRNRHAKSAAMK